MNFSVSPVDSHRFSNILEDLKHVGEENKEHIGIVKDEFDKYIPKVVPKQSLMNRILPTPNYLRVHVVSNFVLDFLKLHKNMLLDSPTLGYEVLVHVKMHFKGSSKFCDGIDEFIAFIVPSYQASLKMLIDMSNDVINQRNEIALIKKKTEEESQNILKRAEDRASQIIKQSRLKAHNFSIQNPRIAKLGTSLRSNPSYDTTIICANGETVFAHKLILASLESSFFTSLFNEHWNKNESIEENVFIHLNDYPKRIVELMLDFLYGKELSKETNALTFLWLYDLANYLSLQDLCRHSKVELKKALNINPALILNLLTTFYETMADHSFLDGVLTELFLSCCKKTKGKLSLTFEKDEYLFQLMQRVHRDYNKLSKVNYVLCLFYQIGNHEYNILEIMTVIRKELDDGNDTALCFYFDKLEFVPDPKDHDNDILDRTIIKAKNGNSTAQYVLGKFYLLYKNDTKSLEWLLKAGKRNYTEAQLALGELYSIKSDFSISIEEKTSYAKESFYWFKQAAEEEDPKGLNQLGECYYNGFGVQKNFKKAFKCYEEAALQNDPEAQYNIGMCLMFGIGTDEDKCKGIEYLLNSAQQDYTLSIVEVGIYYYKSRQYSLAEKWLIKASQKNNSEVVEAELYLGKLFLFKKKDPTEALKWFHKAADHDDEEGDALYYIGLCYHRGYGVQENKLEAISWYKKAAAKKNLNALFILQYLH